MLGIRYTDSMRQAPTCAKTVTIPKSFSTMQLRSARDATLVFLGAHLAIMM